MERKMHGALQAWGRFKWNTTAETFACQGVKQELEGQREIEKRKMGGNEGKFFFRFSPLPALHLMRFH